MTEVYLVYKVYGFKIDGVVVKVFADLEKARYYANWESSSPENKVKQITFHVEPRKVE